MQRAAIESSCLRSVGYNAHKKVLEIEFDSGAVYRYFDVPSAVFHELLRASSKGHYVNVHVRDAFPFERIRGPGAR